MARTELRLVAYRVHPLSELLPRDLADSELKLIIQNPHLRV